MAKTIKRAERLPMGADCDMNIVWTQLTKLLVIMIACLATSGRSDTQRCEEISIPMCRGIGYNFTAMPNQFHHETQEEAGLEVHQFWPLVEIQCSEDLRFFLCSMYTPICMDDYQGQLPACRSVCERAKHGCAPIMRHYGFAWPERMDCNELPVYGNKQQLCMDAKEGATLTDNREQNFPSKAITPNKDGSTTSTTKDTKDTKDTKTVRPTNRKPSTKPRLEMAKPSSSAARPNPAVTGNDCKCECKHPLIFTPEVLDRRFNLSVETGGVANCVIPCKGIFFSKAEKEVATFWISVFAIVCCVCTSLTVLTFFIDMERFRYPERSIIFLSACYLMVSLGYIIRSYVGHEAIACDGPLIRYERTGPAPIVCVTVFILIYFFGMASGVWWVVLTITWFLSAGLKWSNEGIAGYSQYFHVFAWFVPTVMSVIILGIGAIDGDPFAGVCYVGNQELNNLMSFVIVPYVTFLVVGSFFLITGYVSLFRIRKLLRERVKADKLEKLMIRIGFFSFLYIVPGVIVVGCYLYEYYYRDAWQRRHTCDCPVTHETPYYSLFLLKYIMCLIVGITSGFWIWSAKTIDSWGRFYARLCCGSSSSSSRSGGSQLIGGSQLAIGSNRHLKHKQLTHLTAGTHFSHGKQIPLSHV